MKTSSSFFPTRTNLPCQSAPSDRTFNLIRRQNSTSIPPAKIPPLDRNSNIFRDSAAQNSPATIDQAALRPVGGLEMFKRVENGLRERPVEGRKLSKRSKDSTQRYFNAGVGVPRAKKDKTADSDREVPVYSPMRGAAEPQAEQNQQPAQEEIYKSQMAYIPSTTLKSRRRQSSEGPKAQTQRAHSSRPSSKQNCEWDEWAAAQRKSYQDKMALLNEINFNRPLVERYGDRYFEYLLRNRFEEDFQPPVFVYQIGGQFSDSKAIERIRRNGPAVREKTLMVVRGRKLNEEAPRD